MKVGIKTPNINKSIKAKTTGKLKRKLKKTVNPLYGKKGMGFVTDPKRAVYNKVYNKTTIGVSDLAISRHSQAGAAKSNHQTPQQNYTAAATPASEITPVDRSKTYRGFGTVIMILASIIVLISIILLIAFPVAGVLFATFGVVLFIVGRGYTKKSKMDIGAQNKAEEGIDKDSSKELEIGG